MIISLINLIVWLVVIGIIYWLVMWLIDAIPDPQPASQLYQDRGDGGDGAGDHPAVAELPRRPDRA